MKRLHIVRLIALSVFIFGIGIKPSYALLVVVQESNTLGLGIAEYHGACDGGNLCSMDSQNANIYAFATTFSNGFLNSATASTINTGWNATIITRTQPSNIWSTKIGGTTIPWLTGFDPNQTIDSAFYFYFGNDPANPFNSSQRYTGGFIGDLGSSESIGTSEFAITINGTSIEQMGVATVPLPPALYLFGSGLIGLVGMARKNKK